MTDTALSDAIDQAAQDIDYASRRGQAAYAAREREDFLYWNIIRTGATKRWNMAREARLSDMLDTAEAKDALALLTTANKELSDQAHKLESLAEDLRAFERAAGRVAQVLKFLALL